MIKKKKKQKTKIIKPPVIQHHKGTDITEVDLAEVFLKPEMFFGFLKIVDKKGKVVPLALNSEQRRLLSMYYNRGSKNMVVLKPRQIGSSTFFAALLFWKWYTSINPIKIISMSHSYDSAVNFNKMHKCFWDNLPEPLKARELSKCNTSSLVLADTGAEIEVRTAGSKGGMRSFSCNILHISEYAFCSDPEELLATSIPALNDGLLIIESTPNYHGDALHKIITEYERGDSNWDFSFFSWKEHAAYAGLAGAGTVYTTEEHALVESSGLNVRQIAWRRKKISEIGITKFKRDYPLTLDDAYSLTGDSWMVESELSGVDVQFLPGVDDKGIESGQPIILEEPIFKEKYAIGADVATGVGKDYSVLYCISVRTRAPVYIFRSNTIKPSDFAAKMQMVSVKYNGAKVLAERNSIGEVIYSEFKHLCFQNFWRDKNGDGWLTTSKSKPIILERLRKGIANGSIGVVDGWLMDQIRSIKVDNRGYPDFDARDNSNGHFDNIIAFALALTCAESIPMNSAQASARNALDVSIRIDKEVSRISAWRGIR